MKINLIWHIDAWEDYLYFQTHDRKMMTKINTLIYAICREPFSGIGKPEPLRHALEKCWSRRIDQEHRLVYKVTETGIYILQCRYHY